jgi:hypothetical protein
MSEELQQNGAAPAASEAPAVEEKKGQLFPELEELQQEIDRRIRDNKRFLERFLDEDFNDDEEAEDGEDEGEDFEEL